MPIISGGGGGTPFNGGTVAQGLDISAPNGTSPIVVERNDAQLNDLVQINQAGGGFALEIGPAGATYFGSADQTQDQVAIQPINQPNAGHAIFAVSGASGPNRVQVSRSCYLVLNQHVAPADAELAAGEVGVWFDQTNAAAKLMLKAKTADGTVVTAAIALA